VTKSVESEWLWIEGLHAETGEWVGLYNFVRDKEMGKARNTLKALLDLDDEQLLAKHGLTAMEDFRIRSTDRVEEAPQTGEEAPQSPANGSKASREPKAPSEPPTGSQKVKRKRCQEKHPKNGARCIKRVTHTDLHRDLEGRRW
jgi:hypothetical protein